MTANWRRIYYLSYFLDLCSKWKVLKKRKKILDGQSMCEFNDKRKISNAINNSIKIDKLNPIKQ